MNQANKEFVLQAKKITLILVWVASPIFSLQVSIFLLEYLCSIYLHTYWIYGICYLPWQTQGDGHFCMSSKMVQPQFFAHMQPFSTIRVK